METIDLTKEGVSPYTQISAPAKGILELLANSRAGWYIDEDVKEVLEAEASAPEAGPGMKFFIVDLYR